MVQTAYCVILAGETALAMLLLAVLHQIREIRKEQKKQAAHQREEIRYQKWEKESSQEPLKDAEERPEWKKEGQMMEEPEKLINEVLQEIFP